MARARVTMSLPNGKYIEFQGDSADCFAFVQRFAPEATVKSGESSARTRSPRKRSADAIGVREMRAALSRAAPSSDAERVGVIVAVAEEHGRTPVGIPFLRDWFETLELREPAAMRATVSNARKSGWIRAVAHGQFEATDLALALIGKSAGNVVQMPRRHG